MRVVAGSARGRRLAAPPGQSVRPTSDRVREAIFDAVFSIGPIDGATVVDLFAGSGALGIEALSRGAGPATFVDRTRAALDAIRANLAATGFAARATVVAADVGRWLDGAPPFDLALVDPPYAYAGWPALLDRLDAGLAVLESDRPLEPDPGRWRLLREKRYGGTVVTFVSRKA
jgi:16S rRNA (guanine966-N2)-methyltransferase